MSRKWSTPSSEVCIVVPTMPRSRSFSSSARGMVVVHHGDALEPAGAPVQKVEQATIVGVVTGVRSHDDGVLRAVGVEQRGQLTRAALLVLHRVVPGLRDVGEARWGRAGGYGNRSSARRRWSRRPVSSMAGLAHLGKRQIPMSGSRPGFLMYVTVTWLCVTGMVSERSRPVTSPKSHDARRSRRHRTRPHHSLESE